MDSTNEINDGNLGKHRTEVEQTTGAALSRNARRPSHQRAKVLSVRLNPDEFAELARYAEALDLPASALVRGWILDQLRPDSRSPQQTVDRIARELEQLRHQIVASSATRPGWH